MNLIEQIVAAKIAAAHNRAVVACLELVEASFIPAGEASGRMVRDQLIHDLEALKQDVAR